MNSGWLDLGEIDYAAAHALQLRLVERRHRGEIPDLLLLCQHPHVLTVGRRQRALLNVLSPRYPIHEIERGGDVTYHGPGQLVGYPIVRLEGRERDLHAYLRHLEDGLMDLCALCGVEAGRKDGWTGAWTADGARKLASIGIAVRRWVTFHGFALNVTTDLSCFAAINPCGLQARVMTSLLAEGGQLGGAPVSVPGLLEAAAARFGGALGRSFQPLLQSALAELDPAGAAAKSGHTVMHDAGS